jgi:uncharacterized protein YceK
MRLILAVAFCVCLLSGCGSENVKTDPTKTTPPPPGSGVGRKIQAETAPSLD